MRTFSREHWNAALEEWRAGEVSDEWKSFRHAAAMRGIIYPPDGTKWDSWGDDEPSQRAILIRAIRERPRALMDTIERSASWREVIGDLLRDADWMTETVQLRERETDLERFDHPNRLQAAQTIAMILGEIRP